MEKLIRWRKIESVDVALVLGFAIGLGLAAHEIFFVLALIVVLIVAGQWTAEKAHEYL